MHMNFHAAKGLVNWNKNIFGEFAPGSGLQLNIKILNSMLNESEIWYSNKHISGYE